MRALLLARKSNKVKLSADTRGEGLSLETQDEVSRAFAEAQSWAIVGTAGDTVSGRKVKPTERVNLGPWLTDPALIAKWDVLVAAAGDRISRQRIEYWAELEAWCVAHGKTLVVCERGGVYFPPRHEGDTYNWAGIKSGAGNEWDVIRGRNIRSQCAIMRSGHWVGRAPFGYAITGDKYAKVLVPSAVADYVPAIYARSVAGESLRSVASWLTSEGVPTERGLLVWNEGAVKQILRNATYSGTAVRKCAECEGTHNMAVPVLVDMATQARAQAALSGRQRGDNGGGRPSESPALLVPLCDACSVPMYRVQSHSLSASYAYYYCKARTVDGVRKGCGLMVPCDRADTVADNLLSADAMDETTVAVTYPAAELESQIEAVKRAERVAFEADDDDALSDLRTERRALQEALGATERERVTEVPTGRSVGDAWALLEGSERRAWLKRRGISVRLTGDGVKVMTPRGQVTAIGRFFLGGDVVE